MNSPIEGQINGVERQILTASVLDAKTKPSVVLEVGTWLGGGSTLHFLKALEQNQTGHLWGIEAFRDIYDRMIANIQSADPIAAKRFTPLFGFSQDVIPQWLSEQGSSVRIDIAFLDGGDNPGEQITEFKLLADYIPVGGVLFAHDAKLRKGKWLVPYVSRLDNWNCQVHDVGAEGLFEARKIAAQPSSASKSAAERHLLKQRFHPVEIAAAILPSSVCKAILEALPEKLRVRVSQGRK